METHHLQLHASQPNPSGAMPSLSEQGQVFLNKAKSVWNKARFSWSRTESYWSHAKHSGSLQRTGFPDSHKSDTSAAPGAADPLSHRSHRFQPAAAPTQTEFAPVCT